ncbi:MAG TPA: hypothetical protein VKT77_13080, partial [Chthonomonadaceae bacterium]|nr:hypothetical protein [Chthonomonadaceae bacterium]
ATFMGAGGGFGGGAGGPFGRTNNPWAGKTITFTSPAGGGGSVPDTILRSGATPCDPPPGGPVPPEAPGSSAGNAVHAEVDDNTAGGFVSGMWITCNETGVRAGRPSTMAGPTSSSIGCRWFPPG